ncbi:tRNA uridine-5-carboxymethylaminomethyl(34) synthesis GTPase MnmE [Oribacterium sp. P6A1]|uniref:tRNA uridine-5-carboxymethylaminomethyl(34) synthesis GTPase MnmE n=1 Tax=Oribacterium sp. P6A1 TaxID=1410612 RepID=UPI000564D636|nr:tRNA uridine-5-carboxymethylaminomethyl(34) synthesis GTPase MnmE [Oribacterium sp. P6A1]
MINDTICALATAAVESGIGIIRISGSEAVDIASKFIKSKSGNDVDISESHRIKYGFVYKDGEPLDEVLVMTMLAPKSFTGENTVEIDCHGGVLMMQKILEVAVLNGARLAEPGEFTKRAFLNGRIDLSEAEAVGDIISSENDFALKASVNQIRGSVSDKIKKFRSQILEDDAFIEAALDDPEHISLDGFKNVLLKHVTDIIGEIDYLISSSDDGKMLKEGIRTVILGKPNAGKSSLLNILVGSERAIVTDIAGTTRDTLEEHINLKGISLTIVDTAGIRETDDTVEKIGVERALDAADNADLIIYVVDSSIPLDDSDYRIISRIKEKNTIVLLNKSDLNQVIVQNELEALTHKTVIPISAKNNYGIDKLESEITSMFFSSKINFNDQIIITNLRHKNCLIKANSALHEVLNSIKADMSEDFYTIDLMLAYEELGYILGEEVSEDLINEIFSKFCMGK